MLALLIHFIRYHRVLGTRAYVERATPTSKVYHVGRLTEGNRWDWVATRTEFWAAFAEFTRIELQVEAVDERPISSAYLRIKPNEPIANLDLIEAVVLGDPAVTDMLLDVAGKGS